MKKRILIAVGALLIVVGAAGATNVDNLDDLAGAITSSSNSANMNRIKAYAVAQAAATQSQEQAIRALEARVAALEGTTEEPPPPPPSPDTESPSQPVLSLGPATQTSLVLNWQAGKDNVGVDHYNVWLGSQKVAETGALSYTFTGLSCGTSYVLGLEVVDAAGNKSLLAEAQWTTATSACDTPPPPPPPSGSELMGWEVTPQNVGLAPFGLSCSSLPLYTGPNPVPAGTRIYRQRIVPSGGVLNLDAGGILIEQSCIQPTAGAFERMVQSYQATTPNRIIDSEIDGSLLGQQAAAFECAVRGIYGELSRNYMHGMGSGICLVSQNGALNYDAIYTNNYVGNLRAYGDAAGSGSHNEAATTRCFRIDTNPNRKNVWRGNHIETDVPANTSGGLFIQSTYGCGGVGNVYVENNLLDGGGNWDLYADGSQYSGRFEATNNRFAPGGYGPCAVEGFNWTVWSSNYTNDPSATDNKGALIGGC